ncbi:MAG: class B sortase [Ruthenibacterium sp.]
MGGRRTQKQKKIGKKCLWGLLFLLICITLYYGIHLLILLQQDRQSKTTYEQLQAEVLSPEMQAVQTQNENAYAPPIQFAQLAKINSDAIAWLYCAGTPISYPIVQGTDNTYYLKHTIDKKYAEAGCVFLDFRNEPNFSQTQSIVFGHNFYRSDLMFTSLAQYQNQTYYDDFPTMTLFTPTAEYEIMLFSGYAVEAAQYDLEMTYDTPQEYEAFLRAAQEKSDFISNVTPTATDRIFTMCTCSENGADARYLLHGVLKLTAGEE